MTIGRGSDPLASLLLGVSVVLGLIFSLIFLAKRRNAFCPIAIGSIGVVVVVVIVVVVHNCLVSYGSGIRQAAVH